MRLHPFILGLAALCAPLSACMHQAPPTPPDLPQGAIEIREGLYAVPAGTDETGCMRYTLKAPGGMTDQAIRWPARGGGFTANRNEADCPPPKE